jgi:AcrR family transcriptional regulator
MGRPTVHAAATLVKAAQGLAAAGSADDVTIAAVARASGAPVGSIYHRFKSRDGLLAAAWLDAQAAFQSGFVAALARDSGPPGLPAALHVTAWARHDAVRARLLVLHRPREFGLGDWAEGDRERARALGADLEAALDRFCVRHLGGRGGDHRRLATFALLDLPYAAVRRYLAAGIDPPAQVDGYVAAALAAVLPPRN